MSSLCSSIERARTKIVATVGPACREPSRLEALVRAGVDVFRLNTAHGELADLQAALDAIRDIEQRLAFPLGVLVDLAGPKIRLGELHDGAIECLSGQTFRFVRGTPIQPYELTTNYDRLIDELQLGKTIMLADGTVGMRVEQIDADGADVVVTQHGTIRSRQGVNLPGVLLSVPSMSDADRRYAQWAAKAGVDFIGLSFVRSADDVRQLIELVRAAGSSAKIIAKIEKQEALDQLHDIIAAADGVMVARGDLGVEIDVARMPVVQKEIVALANRLQKPVIVATQMLESMQHARRPTRAEVTDVANAILDGCDACMLSGETAIGDYPAEAVAMMNRVALATEPAYRLRPAPLGSDVPLEMLRPVTRAMIVGAAYVARTLDARLIVVASHSGATALGLAKQRNFTPTVGVSDSPAVLRQMSLYWGVIPLSHAPVGDARRLFDFVGEWGAQEGLVQKGDWIVLVAGSGSVGRAQGTLPAQGHNGITAEQVA